MLTEQKMGLAQQTDLSMADIDEASKRHRDEAKQLQEQKEPL